MFSVKWIDFGQIWGKPCLKASKEGFGVQGERSHCLPARCDGLFFGYGDSVFAAPLALHFVGKELASVHYQPVKRLALRRQPALVAVTVLAQNGPGAPSQRSNSGRPVPPATMPRRLQRGTRACPTTG